MTSRLFALAICLLFISSCNNDSDDEGVGENQKILFVSAHPDDEGIFFGGTIPYYAQSLQIPTAILSMTSGNWARPSEIREKELTNAAAVYLGDVITADISEDLFNPEANLFFADLKDCPTQADNNNGGYNESIDATWDWWNDNKLDGYNSTGQDNSEGKTKTIEMIATLIRLYKPTIIATHDLDGEYGHDNHKATALAVVLAYDLASNIDFEDGNTPWQVTKLYVHQSESNGVGTEKFEFENWLFHDFLENNISNNKSMTSRYIANVGLLSHETQGTLNVSTVYLTGEGFDGHASEWWGLLKSTIGKDATTNNPFEINGTLYNGSQNSNQTKWARGNFLIGL